ncbi:MULTISPECIES: hypothetical protein [Flavobacteriaceae]|uniref:hypothetical protein n=1 Tax=Flavobacteriaceae TaxID=49546 RepID=UPI00149136B5|nr:MULTISPECIES: hypothetical protein [Allomuricauda]MDC6367180.1 hypothetical protein [Muricauda sp. AC10]
MKKYLLLLSTLFFSLLSSAQEKIPFIDYDSVSEKVGEAIEKGEYEKTVDYLEKISKNDSTYCSVMVTKSYYLMAQKKYDEAIAVTDEGLGSSCYDLHSSFYVNKVASLLGQDKNQEALEICELGLKRFPQNKTLWYNKGVCLEKTDKWEEAVNAYQETILLDPFYKNVYLKLGDICYKQELISQALMSYNMYLLIEPDASNAFNLLKFLNTTVQSKNKHEKNPDINISKDDESFEEIDLIINNRVALNEKYETGNEIDIALIRQNHALMESLKNFSGNGGFWDTKFVPYYQWIVNQGLFDAFSYTLSYSIENETYAKVIEKKIDDIQEFFDQSKQKWADIVKNNTIQQNGKLETLTYYFEDGYTKGIGQTKNNVVVGPWELFNNKGRLTAKGTFNSDGSRDGEWIFYNSHGKIKESAQYIDGKLNGKNFLYHENGKLNVHANYKNDNLEGEYLLYNKNGALQQKKHFKNGELDGEFYSYHDVGEELLKSQALYVNGSIKGKYTKYFPTGTISSEISFKDGKAHGQETKYYLNGALDTDLNSKNGFVDGYYKLFYPNGSPKEVGQTSEGNYVGHWQTYYSDNTVESDFNYNDKSETDGEYKYYDVDGKLHYIFEYRHGEFIAYKYFDKEGNIIEENRKKGGEFYYKGYSPYGKIKSEGLYDIKGGKKGKWKYYSSHGVLTDEGTYQDDKLQGEYKAYYTDGGLMSIAQYKNDTLNGYYVNYYKSGKINRQGWYKDNNTHGEWRSYAPDGVVTEVNFYHKGLLHGEQLLFSGKGLKTQASIYNYGNQIKDVYYDMDGKVSYTINYEKEEKKYELIYQHLNKKPSTKTTYVNGVLHGPFTFFDFYGRKRSEGNYLNGKLHGKLTWYHDNGNIETVANYVYGELEGDYIYYYEDGTLDTKNHYSSGKLQKDVIGYYKNGTIKNKGEFYDDERHGRRETYCPAGKLQLVRFYDNGRLKGYSYLDENSKELPMIPIENETGKMLTYYDNGKVSRDIEYKNGNLINVYKEYYYSGQLLEEIHYAKGEIDGKRVEYFSNGNIKKERQYQLGNLNGVVREYYENGNLKKEETYLHNIKEGVSKKYDENGKLILEEVYFDGDIISSTSK